MTERGDLIALPEDVFRLLRDLISDYCGLYFDDSSRYIIEHRLNRRLKLHMFDDFRDYYRFLLFDNRKEEEMAAVVDVLTVNETYFFREMNQLKAFSEEICEEMHSAKGASKKLRIWSAGCSSGEEPYTIGMLVLEREDLFGDFDVEIVGSDINRRVLQTARKGVYRKNSFRAIDEYYLGRYFDKEGDCYRIRDEVKRLVNFNHLNLLDPVKAKLIGTMDVIFCRNVLIYFHVDSKRKLIDNFSRKLAGGGYLLLGHAESLMNVSTSFTLRHLKNDMVYQKPHKPASTANDELPGMLRKR